MFFVLFPCLPVLIYNHLPLCLLQSTIFLVPIHKWKEVRASAKPAALRPVQGLGEDDLHSLEEIPGIT